MVVEPPDGSTGEQAHVLYPSYDSSLSLSLLLPGYTKEDALFTCPATGHDIEWQGGKVLPGTGGLAGSFSSVVSESSDPDYVFDPRLRRRAEPGRVILADGPDMDFLTNYFIAANGWSYYTDYRRAREEAVKYANHGTYGANALFYDGHVEFLRWEPLEWNLPNPRIDNRRGNPVDRDIYTNQPAKYPPDWSIYAGYGDPDLFRSRSLDEPDLDELYGFAEEEAGLSADCNLGNQSVRVEIRDWTVSAPASWDDTWPGPDLEWNPYWPGPARGQYDAYGQWEIALIGGLEDGGYQLDPDVNNPTFAGLPWWEEAGFGWHGFDEYIPNWTIRNLE